MRVRHPNTGDYYKEGPNGYALYWKILDKEKQTGCWRQSATISNEKLKEFRTCKCKQ